MREPVMVLFCLLRGAAMLNIRINVAIDLKKVAVAVASLVLVYSQLMTPANAASIERFIAPTHEKPVTVALEYLNVTTTKSDAKKALESPYVKYFDPQTVAFLEEYSHGVPMAQWKCLNTLWQGESHFNPKALNMGSHAYGIAQFLPSTWGNYNVKKTNAALLQIEYGLRYIHARYGTPCGALAFHKVNGWY